MKVFVVALLVAAVAAQNPMDIRMTKGLTRFPYTHHTDLENMVDYPTMKYGMYDDDTTMTVYTLEELMAHPLFREYMSLPLFRQFWQYPAFQKYVTSAYFLKFWTIPTFKTYFIYPTLFYKYIYPCVMLYKYDMTTFNHQNTWTVGDWMWNKKMMDTTTGYPYYPHYYPNTMDYDTTYPHHYPTNMDYDTTTYPSWMTMTDLPKVCHYNTVYCHYLMEKLYKHFNTMTPEIDTTTMDNTFDNTKYNPIWAKMFDKYSTNHMMMDKFYPTTMTKDYFRTVETPKMYDMDMMTKMQMMRPFMYTKAMEKYIPEMIKA